MYISSQYMFLISLGLERNNPDLKDNFVSKQLVSITLDDVRML